MCQICNVYVTKQPDNSYEITKVKAEGKNNSVIRKPKTCKAFFHPTIVLSDMNSDMDIS